ncbi:MAG TPA: amino acid adenylation domain-containing protein, partial [Longimicrobium sp.]
DRLDLLPEVERRLVVEEWNRTEAGPLPDACVHELFEAQVERTPGAVALVAESAALTYRELDGRANRLAHHLRGVGVGIETPVAIHLARGAELVVAMLAVLKAGGAYVPLDPAYPAERLAWMVADSGAAVLVTQERLRGAFALSAGVRVVSVDGDADHVAGERADGPAVPALPGTLAYVIYTSGSTGTPRGVGVEHRSLAAYLAAVIREYGLGAGDRLLQFHSVSFDPAAEEVFATLLSGAALVVREGSPVADPRVFWDACGRDGITVLDLPTAYWHSIVPHLESHPDVLPPSLRLAVTGGERMLPGPLAAWRRVAGGRVRLLNGYGPTEATIAVTLWDTAGAGEGEVAVVPIGAPLANSRCYVLDEWMRPLPVGVPGELYVGGVQVARGYLRSPRATADRFVPEPFGGHAGARLYRTGDRVRWSADGNLEFLERTDFQVKIRGFRIEPGEIEARLAEHPAVRQAVVIARETAASDRRLVAYYMADEQLEVEALRRHVSERLPEHMVPAAYVHLEALPLTGSGKLDRNALPAPEGDAYARRGYEAPQGETEQALAEIWSELLGVERVGRRDNFFELGGHSLLIVKLIARMGRRDLHVEVGTLFTRPTIVELAQAVSRDSLRVTVPPNLIPGLDSIDPDEVEVYV